MQEGKGADITDKMLVEGCRKNDRRYQEMLYRKFSGEMYSICLAYEDDRDKAKDILQEGFIKVFRSIRTFEYQGSLKGWIRKIMTNTAIDYWRSSARSKFMLSIDSVDYSQHPASEEESNDYHDLIRYVERLPVGARVIFNLYALEGYSHKEIAEKLNISEGTSKSQLNRARQILQKHLSEYTQTDE